MLCRRSADPATDLRLPTKGAEIESRRDLEPGKLGQIFVSFPKMDAIVMDSSDRPKPVGFGLESRMPQIAADVQRGFLGRHIQPDQRVFGMAKFAFEKISVAGEERRLLEAMQETDDVLVEDAQTGDVVSNDTTENAARF
jgi:hypothetical protein